MSLNYSVDSEYYPRICVICIWWKHNCIGGSGNTIHWEMPTSSLHPDIVSTVVVTKTYRLPTSWVRLPGWEGRVLFLACRRVGGWAASRAVWSARVPALSTRTSGGWSPEPLSPPPRCTGPDPPHGCSLQNQHSSGSRISHRGGRRPRRGRRQLPRWLRFKKFVCQTKESGPVGGAHAGGAPLDPPLQHNRFQLEIFLCCEIRFWKWKVLKIILDKDYGTWIVFKLFCFKEVYSVGVNWFDLTCLHSLRFWRFQFPNSFCVACAH